MPIKEFIKKLNSFDYEPFVPKTLTCLREGYSKKFFKDDLIAGLTVGVIALPLAMAFAIGSGVAPERGLFTAIIAGFIISLLGGSRFQISGPTGAFVVLIYSVVQKHGYDGLALATLIAAGILILMGIGRCGALIRFIPYPVTTGFTTGIAASIFISQIKDFCGLAITKPSPEFLDRLSQYWNYKETLTPPALLIGLVALSTLILCKRISRKVPGAIIAVIITTLITCLFELPIDTIEKKFGAVPNSLPLPSFPHITLDGLQAVFPDAIAIALLCAIESLLSAVVADGMTGFRHKSNLELIAQGLGNLGSVIFGGIPATGAIARTTANIQMHAKTPFSGMIHAVTLLVLMIFSAPLAGKIPLATLAAILIFVAYNMSEMEHFKEIIKGPKSDALVLLATFLLTVFIDLTVAVQVGVLLAAFLFLKHMTDTTTVKLCKLLQEEESSETHMEAEEEPLWKIAIPKDVAVFEIEGPFFFAVSDLLNEALKRLEKKPKLFVLRLRTVPLIDSSGMHAIKQFFYKCQRLDIEFFITEVRPEVMSYLQKSSVKKTLGSERIFSSLKKAIAATRLDEIKMPAKISLE